MVIVLHGQCILLINVLFAGAVGQTVRYQFTTTCAVKGSTVTLPCTFTPLKSGTFLMKNTELQIIRVRWCQNSMFCFSTTPSVYDSDSKTNDPRYQYLGDLERNCTLQIRDIQMRDNKIFCFRMEADDPAGHFTGQPGVTVRVVGKINTSQFQHKHYRLIYLRVGGNWFRVVLQTGLHWE